jgi:putative transposase
LDARGRWFVSLLVDDHTVKLLPKTIEMAGGSFPPPLSDKPIGLDVGVTSLIATSNGDKIANPKHFKQLHKKLRQVQKAVSRKQKRSNNRQKARQNVAKVHGQITDARKDFLHKLKTQLVRENQTIVVEDLAIKNMVKNHKLGGIFRGKDSSEKMPSQSIIAFLGLMKYNK